MARKKETDYFHMFVEAIEHSCAAAAMLKDIVADYKADEKGIQQIHAIEHDGDRVYHKLVDALNKAFITPIEREDIMKLAQSMDNLTDSIEDIAVRLHMFNITSIRSEAVEFVDLILSCCNMIKQTLVEFKNFKKSNAINGYIIEINRFEEVGDEIYHRAVRRLFEECADQPLEVLKWREAFENMENCCDACEDVADVIEGVIMKNT